MKAVDALNTADAEIGRIAWPTPRVLTQRSAGVSDCDDSAHQGELERHGGRRSLRAAMRMAHCAAIARGVLIEDARMQATSYERPHAVSCH